MTKKTAVVAALAAVLAAFLLAWLVPKLSEKGEYARPGLSTVDEVVGVIQSELRPGDDASRVAAFAEKHGMEAGGPVAGTLTARIRYARESGPHKTLIVIRFIFDDAGRLSDYTITEEYETL